MRVNSINMVVRNVFSNAVKFSAPGGYIRILTRRRDQGVELQIHDAGLGMSAGQLAVLFSTPEVRQAKAASGWACAFAGK